MQSFDDLYRKMGHRLELLQKGHLSEGDADDLIRLAMRDKQGCPSDETLCWFFEGKANKKEVWVWTKVWSHIHLRRCALCQSVLKDLAEVFNSEQPSSNSIARSIYFKLVSLTTLPRVAIAGLSLALLLVFAMPFITTFTGGSSHTYDKEAYEKLQIMLQKKQSLASQKDNNSSPLHDLRGFCSETKIPS